MRTSSTVTARKRKEKTLDGQVDESSPAHHLTDGTVPVSEGGGRGRSRAQLPQQFREDDVLVADHRFLQTDFLVDAGSGQLRGRVNESRGGGNPVDGF
jgi:hypothetical protein